MTQTAPPQSPSAQAAAARAVVVRPEDAEVAQDLTVQSVAGRDDVERFETTITIPVEYQYAIPIKGKKKPNGDWDNDAAKVGLLSDAYDYMNRVVGASFFMPAEVHDQEGVVQPNPIHRKDYIYLRLGCVYYNPMGQLVLAVEDVEVDFQLVWMDARVNAKSAEVMLDENGMELFDSFGNPAVKVNKEDALKALRELTRLRSFGPRYAFTVARTRLLKIATGIRSVPNSTQPKPFKVRIVGYRDKMTPQERVARVAGDMRQLYGSAPDIKPLSGAEMAAAGFDAEAEAAAGETDTEPAATATEQPDVQPVAQAQVAPDTCGARHPEEDEVCLIPLDANGTHAGGHMNAPEVDQATLLWPQK